MRSLSSAAALLTSFFLGTAVQAQDHIPVPQRDAILTRAQVWLPPATPLTVEGLRENPSGPDSFSPTAVVECRFKPDGVGGSTPKFDCELPSGEDLKVKYGRDNPEVFSEVIASRLLAALGFPTDRMYVVDQVRCFGCPPDPFAALQCLNEGEAKETCFPAIDYKQSRVFADAVLERSVPGRRIEVRRDRGWRWDELHKIDPAAGGAPSAHVDALRLMAVFLGHWDNKSKNQRLLCLGTPKTRWRSGDSGAVSDPGCEQPLAMVQDLGDAFGPFKLDLDGWRKTPVWADAASCRVSMRQLPYGGSTFKDIAISEAGRAFLAPKLAALTPAHVRALFEGARLARYQPKDATSADIDAWVDAFISKARTITDRPPCPA